MRAPASNTSGSALIWTLFVVAILSLAAGQLLDLVSSKYHAAFQTATWQESLIAAESGVDLAVRELRKSLFPAPNGAWSGWTSTPGAGITSYGLTTIPSAGLSGSEMKIEVTVDAPLQLRDSSNSWQYYRIRTVGTMPLIGPARANDNRYDTRLRKLALRWDRMAGTAVASPSVSRRIEAIVRPVSAFAQAITADGALDLTDNNIIVDSYDSRDAAKSTSGLYDAAKRQNNGNIATNGTILNAGNARIYGNVATNSGVASGIANITGIERTDFYQDMLPVAAPSWPSVNASPMNVVGTTNLAASSTEGSSASRYILSSITLSGTQTLTLTGNADGSRSYVEIYVTGNVDAVGNAQITISPGVRAKIYVAGHVKISGNGILNRDNQPANLLIYGIDPPPNETRILELGGNSLLSAAVYAPRFDVQVNNGGTRGSVFGSFVGKSVKMVGVTDLHYDEALGSSGAIYDYKIVSWFEDTR